MFVSALKAGCLINETDVCDMIMCIVFIHNLFADHGRYRSIEI